MNNCETDISLCYFEASSHGHPDAERTSRLNCERQAPVESAWLQYGRAVA